jgi:hypothetical protein
VTAEEVINELLADLGLLAAPKGTHVCQVGIDHAKCGGCVRGEVGEYVSRARDRLNRLRLGVSR